MAVALIPPGSFFLFCRLLLRQILSALKEGGFWCTPILSGTAGIYNNCRLTPSKVSRIAFSVTLSLSCLISSLPRSPRAEVVAVAVRPSNPASAARPLAHSAQLLLPSCSLFTGYIGAPNVVMMLLFSGGGSLVAFEFAQIE